MSFLSQSTTAFNKTVLLNFSHWLFKRQNKCFACGSNLRWDKLWVLALQKSSQADAITFFWWSVNFPVVISIETDHPADYESAPLSQASFLLSGL